MVHSASSDTVETPVRTVLVTAPDRETADRIAHALVGERLAACANVLPGVTSVFRWEGEVERAAEVLLVVKTAEDRLDELEARIEALHPYDVPEVLALPGARCNRAYHEWVVRETRPDAGADPE
jgi:periplasmic divalent cation tolerance protein